MSWDPHCHRTLGIISVGYCYCQHLLISLPTDSGIARPKLMVGPDYRGTKEVLEDLALAAPG